MVKKGMSVLPFIKGVSERVVVEFKGAKHTFRPELFSLLKELEGYSKSQKPFLVKNMKEAKDDFERIAMAHHLKDLDILVAVELARK